MESAWKNRSLRLLYVAIHLSCHSSACFCFPVLFCLLCYCLILFHFQTTSHVGQALNSGSSCVLGLQIGVTLPCSCYDSGLLLQTSWPPCGPFLFAFPSEWVNTSETASQNKTSSIQLLISRVLFSVMHKELMHTDIFPSPFLILTLKKKLGSSQYCTKPVFN